MARVIRDTRLNHFSKILKEIDFRFQKILPKKTTHLSPYKYISNTQILQVIELFDIFV
jgi:hypothetical protein